MAGRGDSAPGASEAYSPVIQCVPHPDCRGLWVLLVLQPGENGTSPVARGLAGADGYDIAPGVERKQGVTFNYLDEVAVTLSKTTTVRKKVWGAVMVSRKGRPWLAVGDKDGSNVALVWATDVGTVKTHDWSLGAKWDCQVKYNDAADAAGAAIDQLVLQRAAEARANQNGDSKTVELACLTKAELEEEARKQGYVLVTPHELEERTKKAEEWKEIALAKEDEIKNLKTQHKKVKQVDHHVADTAATPATLKRDREEPQGDQKFFKTVKKLDLKVNKMYKKVKKVKKMVKEMKKD